MASRLSKHFINMGLVGIGSIGISIVVLFVPFTSSMYVMAFLFTLFGIFSGFLMVPLNARIQFLSSRVHLGTILAGNNFVQNIFMVSFLALTTIFAYNGMNTKILFYLMSLVGLYLTYKILKRYFVDTFWALMKIFGALRHRYYYVGLENVPSKGAALLISNHVSWLDWVLIQLPIKRHINYMMEKDIYHWRVFHAFFKKGGAIPVSSKGFKDAFREARKRLKSGSLVGIFAEGAISDDGSLGEFHRGYELIGSDYEGMIIPVFIDDGIFGSIFARAKPKVKKSFFRRRVITIYYGEPLSADTSAKELRNVIQNMKEKYETK
jgi:acyl-[acyl-carrier-protein]-phospholipid O-acyltransferase/long-chain-fatty-acid--[acyl-carrier-protein] ligase